MEYVKNLCRTKSSEIPSILFLLFAPPILVVYSINAGKFGHASRRKSRGGHPEKNPPFSFRKAVAQGGQPTIRCPLVSFPFACLLRCFPLPNPMRLVMYIQ